MAGTGWQSSDLLIRFQEWAQLPATNAPITDAAIYRRLSDGQDQVILETANLCGRILYGAPSLMASTDGGATYTYGVDGNGYPLFPLLGAVYPTLSAIPSFPWVPGRDYLDEGTTIRAPYNTTFPNAPYFYGITTPGQLSASVQPVIQPPASRVLIVEQAVRRYAEEGARDSALAATMAMRWQEDFPRWATAIRKHLRGPRSLGPLTSGVSPGGWGGSMFGGMGW